MSLSVQRQDKDNRRTKKIEVRVTPEEKETIEAGAERERTSVSAYVRKLVLLDRDRSTFDNYSGFLQAKMDRR